MKQTLISQDLHFQKSRCRLNGWLCVKMLIYVVLGMCNFDSILLYTHLFFKFQVTTWHASMHVILPSWMLPSVILTSLEILVFVFEQCPHKKIAHMHRSMSNQIYLVTFMCHTSWHKLHFYKNIKHFFDICNAEIAQWL